MTTQASPKRRVATYPRMSEDELLSCVLDLAEVRGWRRYHQRPNRLGQIVQGDRGFPDLVLIRGAKGGPLPWMRFVELKSDRGHVSSEQQAWLDALFPYSYVWRPQQWRDGTIERALR